MNFSNNQIRILVVDDTQHNILLLANVLKQEGYQVHAAFNGRQALKVLKKSSFDLILLDVLMPEMDGFETCRHLKEDETLRKIPVIFMTALEVTDNKVKGFELGAVDYITKPFIIEEVLVRIRTHLHNHLLQRKLQQMNVSLKEQVKERTKELHEMNLALASANQDLENKVQLRTRELQQAKDDAEKAKEKAEVANRAKSAFVTNLSHEIRTPMNAVLGLSEILNGLVTDTRQREYLFAIRTSSKSLLGLINDILDLSRIETDQLILEYQPLLLRELFLDIQVIFSPKFAEMGVELLLDIDPHLPTAISCDELRFRQILVNLIGNAMNFTDTGYVKLSVVCQEQTSETLDLLFSVEDTGMGIAEDQCDRIFDAFEQHVGQNHAIYGGTGLGLALTKRLVEMMNGTISLSSTIVWRTLQFD